MEKTMRDSLSNELKGYILAGIGYASFALFVGGYIVIHHVKKAKDAIMEKDQCPKNKK